MGVLVGGSISVLSGQLLSNGMADLRAGNLLTIDEAAWIPTAFNMAIVFNSAGRSSYRGLVFPEANLMVRVMQEIINGVTRFERTFLIRHTPDSKSTIYRFLDCS